MKPTCSGTPTLRPAKSRAAYAQEDDRTELCHHARVNETAAASPPDAARSTFVLNALGIGLVLALGVLTYVRLTRTTSASETLRLAEFLEYCVVAGVWTGIAAGYRKGRGWARTAGTVSFALWLLPVIVDSIAFAKLDLDAWQTATGLLAILVGMAGLGPVLGMWRGRSARVRKALG